MRIAIYTLNVALAGTLAMAAERPHVSIRAMTAAISVTGGAADVSATLYDASGTEVDGLLIVREEGRTEIVLVASVRPGARIEARVPSTIDLRVEGSNGGLVTVRRVSGQLEIVNSNAGIALEGISGAVLASTSNGPIEATFRSIDPGLPMSLLTSNGQIEVTLPSTVQANLRTESDTGPVTSEFELARINGEPIERKILRGGRLRTVTHGAVNGGGPEIVLRTENAPIVIRRHK